MKHTTRQLLGIAVASALIVGVTGGVLAHGGFGSEYGPFGSGYGPGWGRHHGMMGDVHGLQGSYCGPGFMAHGFPQAYSEKGLDRLKATLGITADQESAWNAYVEAVKDKAALVTDHHETRFGTEPITAEERLNLRQEGVEQMQKVIDASRELYAVLTPQQRAKSGGLVGPRCAAW